MIFVIDKRLGRMSLFIFVSLLVSCTGKTGSNGSDSGGGGGDSGVSAKSVSATNMTYVLLAWNDLGMHCLNPTYDKAVILPPYNTVWAQMIQRGNPPAIVSSGITLSYSILNNTTSYGKRSYGQFWDNAFMLFGTTLAPDTGLNLEDPNIHNGLSGTMIPKGDHFQVNGIPVTPVDDALNWSPYQVIEIVANSSSGAELARTRATVPTSDEINCAKCHGVDPLLDVLQKHDSRSGTALAANRPVLCASCHGSPALGQSGPGSSNHYLSGSIHSFHATQGAACYDCHPGATTKCSRSTAHTASDGNCTSCHGDLNQVGGSVEAGTRIPWVNEPKCSACHASVYDTDTGAALFRNARGHGGVSCPACHGSPHAMLRTNQDSDGYQAKQYQSVANTIGVCSVCHRNSRGGGISEFSEEHGGSRATACAVCHTKAPSTDTKKWPHQFQWKAR